LLGLLSVQSASAQLRCDQVLTDVTPRQFNTNESWGQQTVEREIDTMAAFFNSTKKLPDDERVAALMKADVRRSFFRLQILSRMLVEFSPHFFTSQRQVFKSLEDATGKLDLALSLVKTAQLVNEPKLLEFFGRQQAEAQGVFIKTMKDAGLWGPTDATAARMKQEFARNG
jgi:hypothetical protein